MALNRHDHTCPGPGCRSTDITELFRIEGGADGGDLAVYHCRECLTEWDTMMQHPEHQEAS